jgi:hypothetical protein
MENDVLVTPHLRSSPPERCKFVALRVEAGKSNRAIARELDVDEGTIRRDRKFLATPESERPVRAPRPKKPRQTRPVTEEERTELSRRRFKRMLIVVRRWIVDQGLILPDIEYVLHEAGRHLHQERGLVNQLPDSPHSPVDLLPMTRPNREVEDYMPAKLDYCAEWLARWLACCLPRDEARQDEFLRAASIWARSG